MNIVFFAWRDLDHPKAGGAETHTHRMAQGLATRGHQVMLFSSMFRGARPDETRDGYRVVCRGNEMTCRIYAAAILRSLRDQVDVVVDELNTLPFLSPTIAPEKAVLFIHELAREAAAVTQEA